MALNLTVQVYRGTLANLSVLATMGKAGVLAWTTDTNEIYVDAGTGSEGIGAGNAWQKVAQDYVAVNAQTGTTYSIAGTDRAKLVTLKNAAAIAVTLPQAGATFPNGWWASFSNQGAGLVTITPTTSTINGGASLTVAAGNSVEIISDGTNYYAMTGKTSINVTAPITHEFATSNNADGSLNLAQPAFTDISGVITQAQLPASIGAGSNLTSVDC